MKTYVVTPHQNRLGETVLMMGCNKWFKEVTWKIIPKLSLLSLLSEALTYWLFGDFETTRITV